MDLISHGFALDSRKLFPGIHQALRSLARSKFPEKFNIRVLREVFDAFLPRTQLRSGGLRPIDLSFQLLADAHAKGEEAYIKPFKRSFEYAGRSWTGTVGHHVTEYNDSLTYFINIRLPNDGYFYSEKYAEKQEPGDGVYLDATDDDAYEMVRHLLASLLAFHPQGFQLTGSEDVEEVIPLYCVERQELDLKFYDPVNQKCLTIVWHYGYCNNVPRKRMTDAQAQRTFHRLAAVGEKG